MSPIEVEIAVDSLESARAALAAGAHRLELASALDQAGISPGLGLLEAVLASTDRPVSVLIRPRGGDFHYSTTELETMETAIRAAARAGASAVVTGVLAADGGIDVRATRRLMDAAEGLEFGFHRAFDLSRDPGESLDRLLELGCDRLLSSGCRSSAWEGVAVIAELVRRAGDRLRVMAAGGLRADRVRDLVRRTGVRSVHLGPRLARPSGMVFHASFSLSSASPCDSGASVVDAAEVARVVEALAEGAD